MSDPQAPGLFFNWPPPASHQARGAASSGWWEPLDPGCAILGDTLPTPQLSPCPGLPALAPQSCASIQRLGRVCPPLLGAKGSPDPGSARGSRALRLPCQAGAGAELQGTWPSCAGGRGGSGIAGARVPSCARPWSQVESVGPRPQTIWRFPQAHASTQAAWQWWQAPAFPLAAAKLAAGLCPPRGPSWSPCPPPTGAQQGGPCVWVCAGGPQLSRV